MTKSLKYNAVHKEIDDKSFMAMDDKSLMTMDLNKFPISIGLKNFSRIIRDTRKPISNLTKKLKRNLLTLRNY